MHRWSGSRVTFWVLFLSTILSLGASVMYSSTLLDLSSYQPQIVDTLQKTFHCRVIVGHVHGELIPHPGVVVGPVVFIDRAHPKRILASARSVHVWLALDSLWSGPVRFTQIRFGSPRFIVHREPSVDGSNWTTLTLARRIGPSMPGAAPVDSWDIRNGQLEIWDHTVSPVERWTVSPLTGSFQMSTQRGQLTAKAPRFGKTFLLTLRYDGSEEFPVQAMLNDVDLRSVCTLLHKDLPALDAAADLKLLLRLQPTIEVKATLEPTTFVRLNNARLRGTAGYRSGHYQLSLQTGTTSPMMLSVAGMAGGASLTADGKITGYDGALVQTLYSQAWLDRLSGPGSIDFSVQSAPSAHVWSLSANGRDFALADSAFMIPTLSVFANPGHLSVGVHATTPDGGTANVTWAHDGPTDPTLKVDAGSVTIRQVLDVFSLESKQAVPAGSTMNPYGYEPWRIQYGTFQSVLHPDALEIQASAFDIGDMHLAATGTFGLRGTSRQAQLTGTLSDIPMQPTIENFFPPPAPLTGTGALEFNVSFPLSPQWLQGLNGPLTLTVEDGVLKLLKTAYRVVSVLNLGNYLRLRFPSLSAEGIVFTQLTGHLTFTNGALSTDDLFLKSPNMNVGAKGSVDLAKKSIDCTLRLEMFRFLEDVLKDVPFTHWIFKKPTKIFLPLVVNVKGPWDDVDVR